METFGWLVFIVGGAYAAFQVSFIVGLTVIRGGLESIAPALGVGVLVAVVWVLFTWWLSPFTITFGK
jgi:hypothetical protein